MNSRVTECIETADFYQIDESYHAKSFFIFYSILFYLNSINFLPEYVIPKYFDLFRFYIRDPLYSRALPHPTTHRIHSTELWWRYVSFGICYSAI